MFIFVTINLYLIFFTFCVFCKLLFNSRKNASIFSQILNKDFICLLRFSLYYCEQHKMF